MYVSNVKIQPMHISSSKSGGVSRKHLCRKFLNSDLDIQLIFLYFTHLPQSDPPPPIICNLFSV